MRKILFLSVLAVMALSCNNDNDDNAADLFLDRGLNDAPFLDPGEYIAAARFSANTMSEFQGRKLEGIEYYLINKPTQAEVRVYQGSNGNEPENLVYSASVTLEMDAESWNLHSPSSDINLTGEDLWIAIRLVHANRDQTIGCDPGPAVTNGDWFSGDGEGDWQTFRNFTNDEVNINWNIRGHVSD